MLRRAICLLVLAFVVSAVGVRAQRDTTAQPDAKPSDSTKNIGKGIQEGDTYANASIGIIFSVPKMTWNLPEMRGTPGTVPLFIMVPATGEPGTGVLTFYADALDFYPEDERTTAGYMQKLINDQAAQGYKRVDGKATQEMGGTTFARADLVKGFGAETILVTVNKGFGFEFFFTGPDVASVDKRIASMTVKVTP